MSKRFIFSMLAAMSAGVCPAISVTVAPTTGVTGTAVTNTIEDAIAQINTAGEGTNSIVLRSIEGAITLPPDTLWSFNPTISADFTAENGQPVVVLTSGGTRYMLAIAAGTNANNQTETLTFTNIAFVPQAGLSFVNNIADGISLGAGNYVFTNCVFSNNDGTNGVASQNGDVDYSGVNCVGDDWIQMNGLNDVTLSNCTITGANDDALLLGGASAPEISTTLLNKGTCIANNGGAGIQVFGTQTAVVLDGSDGRVQIANNGHGPAAPTDTGIKFFADAGCSLSMTKADIIGHNNGGIFDFDGVPNITITESRIALNNSGDIATAANLSIAPTDTDNAATNQNITLDNVTFHDALGTANPDSIYAAEGANYPQQTFTIVDSIFSGAGDSFVNMTNATNSNGISPAPAVTFTAVVTAGPDAVANTGDLGTGSVSSDPAYVSTTYSVGRNQENPTFLLPVGLDYLTASSGGTLLRGGAPAPLSGVKDFMLY